MHGRSERHLPHLSSPFIVPFTQKAMGKRRSNRVKEMKSQWKRRHLKCETNRSVIDFLWQPLVNTLKETHILLMDVEHPAPEVVSPTWSTNFRKKMGGWPSSVHQLLFKFRKMLGMDFSQSPWISSHQGEGSHCPPSSLFLGDPFTMA